MGLGSNVWTHPSWLNHNASFTNSEKTVHFYFIWLLEVLLSSFPIIVDEEVAALQDWHQVIASGASFYFNDLDLHDFFYHLSPWKASSSSYPMSTILSFTVLQLFYVRHSSYSTRIMLEIQQLSHLELHQLASNWIKKKIILHSSVFLQTTVSIWRLFKCLRGYPRQSLDSLTYTFSQALFWDCRFPYIFSTKDMNVNSH